MNLFVDTSVWSLALRRDQAVELPSVALLAHALEHGQSIFSTGLVLQELLQGFAGARAEQKILKYFSMLPFVTPDRDDHVESARLRNHCRRRGVQIGTIDALLARLCIRHELCMVSEDRDFESIARHAGLRLWRVPA